MEVLRHSTPRWVYSLIGIGLAMFSLGGIAMVLLISSEPDPVAAFGMRWMLWTGVLLSLLVAALLPIAGFALGRREEELLSESFSDALTGLSNRRYFRLRGNQEIARARRYQGSLSLLMVDLDNLKQLNDTSGHNAGDLALKQVADDLAASFRESDVVARIGGDEFAVLLPETSGADAYRLAERIRHLVYSSTSHHKQPLSLSIGVASASNTTATLQSLIDQADEKLYAAKAAGRNCVIGHAMPDRGAEEPSRDNRLPDQTNPLAQIVRLPHVG